MNIDVTIKNSKCTAWIGMYSYLSQSDKNWLSINGYTIKRWCNGVLFLITSK